MPSDRLSVFVYRLLLRLLPRPLREDYGGEMERLFADRLQRADGLHARTTIWARAVGDVLSVAVAERLPPPGLATLLDDLRLDLRFGARSLRRTPVPTSAAVLALALGLGTVTGLFSVVNGVLLQPLPYPHADRLVTVTSPYLDPGNVNEWRDGMPGMEASGAYSLRSGTAQTPDGAVAVRVLLAGDGLLELLALRPRAGRPFVSPDHDPGAAPVALVSHSFARRWPDGKAVGRALELDGRLYEVVGTLAEESMLRYEGLDVWVPLESADVRGAWLMARLEPGVDAAAATAALTPLAERMATPAMRARIEHVRVPAVRVTAAREALLLGIDDTIWLLFAAGGVVLVLAVVNVAALLLGRALDRSEELAVRVALGAGRRRLVRQLLAEAALLGAAGVGLGLALAAAVPWLLAKAPDVLPRVDGVTVDGRTVAFAVATAVACVALLGTLPGLVMARRVHGPGPERRGGTGGRRAGRAQEGLAVAQVAMALVLVVGSALLLRTYLAVRPTDPGFVIEGRTVLEVELPEASYRTEESQRRFASRIVEEMRTVPGVADAALATDLPLTGESMVFPAVAVEGVAAEGERPPNVHTRAVSPDYLGLMEMELAAGRGIEPSDGAGAPHVAVVNETTATRLFGEGTLPLGRELTLEVRGRELTSTVVGVARDAWVLFGPEPRPEVFLPFEQVPFRRFKVVLASPPGTTPAASGLRNALAAVDPRLPAREIAPFSELAAWSFALPRFQAMLLGGLAFIALVLAGTGCFGVLSRLVARRTRELGIRMALGARVAHVLWLVLRRAGAVAALGIVLGAVLARAGGRLLAAQLHGVRSTDPVALVGAAMVLLITVAAAALQPTLRAARTDPARTLREE